MDAALLTNAPSPNSTSYTLHPEHDFFGSISRQMSETSKLPGIHSDQIVTVLLTVFSQASGVQAVFMLDTWNTVSAGTPMLARLAQIVRLVDIANSTDVLLGFAFLGRIRSQT